MLQPKLDPLHAHEMPALYYERTTPEERRRHRPKLERVAREGGLLIEAAPTPQGGWLFEIVTTDWDEPGLLDKIFEAILRCHRLEHGISIQRARIFTGSRGQVVNLLDLHDRHGRQLNDASRETVLERLREIRPGERGVLETIQNFPYRSLIPLLDAIPAVNNEVSEHYTCLELNPERVSNRFTSVLLHFLARSELWLNIQVAEIEQGARGRYVFYVVDKQGRKLEDSHVVRRSLVRTLEAINGTLTRFNLHYVRREWEQRIERNQHTLYHSRPDFSDYLEDLANIRQMAGTKGLDPNHLSRLVEHGLLDSQSLYFLKKVEAWVNTHLAQNRALVERPPTEADVELVRQYFEYRRHATRILAPLFQRLIEMPTASPLLSPRNRLYAMCRPFPQLHYALDEEDRLYLDGPVWLSEPSAALDSFLLMARTDCHLRPDTVAAIEASLEGWNEFYIAEHREALGARFLSVLDESIRQGNTPTVLRNLRSVGLLQRYLPGFEPVQGRIHVNADHAYTVDEHSFVVIDVLMGLRLLGDVLPEAGPADLREDYERLRDHSGLKNYARKYAMELHQLARVPALRMHPAVRPFFHVMEEARRNSLEYLIEVNLLEFGHETSVAALDEIEKVRTRLDGLIRRYRALPFEERRVLVLAGLLHDLKKPAQEHGPLGAAALDGVLDGMGLRLPAEQVERLRWLIRHHLDIRPLINQIGAEGEAALARFTAEAGDPTRVTSLILFTFADRMAVRFDLNANAHDAAVLSDMLARVEAVRPARE
jgi:UTP:GlnB (protein PII) uridylyltransferase